MASPQVCEVHQNPQNINLFPPSALPLSVSFQPPSMRANDSSEKDLMIDGPHLIG